MLKNNLVNFLKKNDYDYLLVNSTNEFLVEYNELEQNARYYLTGFSGSTGEALLSKNSELALFVDGRYHKQADNQAFEGVEVVKLQLGETFLSALSKKIRSDSKLAIVANKTPLSFFKSLIKAFEGKNIEIAALDFDPVFEIVEKKPFKNASIIDIPIEITGQTTEEKIKNIQNELSKNEVRLVTNLEQIAWILNKRSFAQNFSSTFKAKLIVEKNDYKVFYADELIEYEKYLKNTEKTFIYAPKTLSYGDFLLIKDKSEAVETDKIENAKSIKNDAELNHLKSCFERTDIVVTKTANFVNSKKNLSEQELIKFVEKEFFKLGARSLSFNTILASGKNSALAHYAAQPDAETLITEGDFILLDCGAYFEGGYSTDITRVFCAGASENEAKTVYTTVLKAGLRAYNTPVSPHLSGFELDKIARNTIAEAHLAGYNFNHATGHGVGINVHEFPPSISPSELAKTPLKDGMVFTIEPGAYNPDFGGVRLENTVYLKNGKITSFSKVRFEEKLINYELLNEQEKIWLKDWQENALCL